MEQLTRIAGTRGITTEGKTNEGGQSKYITAGLAR